MILQICFLFVVAVGLSTAVPILVEDTQGVQYYLIRSGSEETRQKRDLYGEGAATGKTQGGYVGKVNPNGSGGQIGYGHQNGYGHTGSIDGRVPVWSGKNRFGETTLNVGGGASRQFGGPGGSHNTDKRVGANINHRW